MSKLNNKEIKELVKIRLNALPDNIRMSIGAGDFSKSELLERVSKGDDVGKKIIEMSMQFLRNLEGRELYE